MTASKKLNLRTFWKSEPSHCNILIWASYWEFWPNQDCYCYLPRNDLASSSKKEVVWIGMSCISQVQLPCGRLPGNGQVLPEIGTAIFKSFLDIVIQIHYQWDNWAMHMPLSFLSTSCSLGCNSNLYTSLLCTDACYWCTISDYFLTKWRLTSPFPDRRRGWSQSHRFWGRPYNSRMDKARPRELSIGRHSLHLARKSPPQKCLI